MELIGIEKIRAARETLNGIVRRTPLKHSRVLTQRCGVPVHLKCENLQRTGSFKIRGAYVRIQALPKLAATRGYGAQVHLVGDIVEESMAAARRFAEDTGAVFIHPFDHPDVLAGQGTVGLEVLEQLPEAGTVLVPTGGGGLIGGIAAAVKGIKPDVTVIGVQAESAAVWPASLAAGAPVRLCNQHTMADGIAVAEVGPVSFAHVSSLVDDVLTVGEEALSQALLLCLERAKMVVEPAGAAAVATLLEPAECFAGPVCAVLSGGNVDPLLLMHVIQHGLGAADRPGELAALLGRVGESGANVVDVAHSRIAGSLAVGHVVVALSLETRGREHCEELVADLGAAGYQVGR